MPFMSGCTGDAAEVFRLKHNLVCNEMAPLSFASKNFKSDTGTLRKHSRTGSFSPQLGMENAVSFVSRII